jgi:hypothetical protein
VSVGGQPRSDHRAGGLVVGQCPQHLSVFVEPERVRRIDDDPVVEQVAVLRDQFLDRVEPDRENHDVCSSNRVLDGGGACKRSDLVRDGFRV